jgi:hypothetical protein
VEIVTGNVNRQERTVPSGVLRLIPMGSPGSAPADRARSISPSKVSSPLGRTANVTSRARSR